VRKLLIDFRSSNEIVKQITSISLINCAKDKQLSVKGPVNFSTKVLNITTSKTRCGEGSITWDGY